MNLVSSGVIFLMLFNFVKSIAGEEVDKAKDKKGHSIRCTSASKDVAACIHTYLEKDFLSISRIVYPKVVSERDECQNSEEFERKNHIMMDGPALDNSCNDLQHVFKCLRQELDKCDARGPYFELRHLLYSLKKIMTWLCGRPTDAGEVLTDQNPHTAMRSRFLVLLESIKCLECVRMSRKDCVPAYATSTKPMAGDVALWNKILRLEVSSEICRDLKVQVDCLQNGDYLERACGHRASELHGNLTNIFLESWCDNNPLVPLRGTGRIQRVALPVVVFTLCLFTFIL